MSKRPLRLLLAMVLTLCMLLTMMPMGVWAAESTMPSSAWDSTYTTLKYHGTPTEDGLKSYFKALTSYVDPMLYDRKWDTYWSSLGALQDYVTYAVEDSKGSTVAVANLKDNESYTLSVKGEINLGITTVSYDVEVATFTIRIFDVLTVNTTAGSETTEYYKVYRSDGTQDITVADKSGDGYKTVAVSGAVEGTEAKTYTVEMGNADKTVNVVYTLDTDSTIETQGDDHVTVSAPATVEAGKDATVIITPATNYYIATITKDGEDWISEDAFSDGTFTDTITGPASKSTITVAATSGPVLTLSDELTIAYNSTMTADQIKTEILKLVSCVDGNATLTFQFIKNKIGTDETVALTDANLDSFGTDWSGSDTESETIIVSYAGSDRYPSASVEFTVSLEDKRKELNLNIENATVYLNGVKDSTGVTYPSSYTVAEALETMDFSITGKDLTTINNSNYAENGVSVSIKEQSISGVIGGGLSTITSTGTYRVTVEYKNDAYADGGVSDTKTLTVSDGRPTTAITLKDAELKPNTKSFSWSQEDIETAMDLTVTATAAADSNKTWNLTEGYTVTITDANGAAVTAPITELGTYKVTVSYAGGETTYQAAETKEATLTITDGRETTSVTIKNSGEIDYENHNAWLDNWKKEIIDAMSISVTDVANADDVTLYTLYTVVDDEGNKMELTKYPGAGEYIIVAAYAGDDTHKPSESAQAKLTLKQAPGATTVNVAVTNATVTATIDGQTYDPDTNGNITVEYGKKVVLTFTASDGYYLPENASVIVGGENVVLDNGTITITVTEETAEAPINVSLTATAKATTSITANDVTVNVTDLGKVAEFVPNDKDLIALAKATLSVADGGNITVTVNNGEAITAVGTYDLTFSYVGGDTTLSTSTTVKLILNDARPAATLAAKKNVTIGYNGSNIDANTIIAAVFDAEGSSPNIGAELSLKKSSLGYTITKEVGGHYVTATMNEIKWDGTTEGILGIQGNYKVTLFFAGNNQYTEATEEVTFTVTDNRAETVITAENTEKPHNDKSAISYDAAAVINATGAKVMANNDEVGVPTISTVKKEGNTIYSSLTESVSPLSITEYGVYEITYSYAGGARYKAAENVTATLTIQDTRPNTTVNLTKGAVLDCTDQSDPITTEKAFDKIFVNVTAPGEETSNDPVTVVAKDAEAYSKLTVTMLDADKKEIKSATAAGTYYLEVSFVETDTYHGNTAEVAFTVTDGRKAVEIKAATDTIPYDFAEGLTAAEVLEALNIQAQVKDGDIIAAEYVTVTLYNADGQEMAATADYVIGAYKAVAEYDGNDVNGPAKVTFDFNVIDGRSTSTITLNKGKSVTYKAEGYTEAEILELVFASLTNAKGENITAAKPGETAEAGTGALTVEVPELNVGTHTITVNYAGDYNNKPAEAQVEITVTKAPVTVTVTGTTLHYTETASGYNAENIISVEPADCETITYVVGLSLGANASEDVGTVVYVDIPSIVDLDSIEEPLKSVVQEVLNKLETGTTMTISKLKTTLEGVLSGLQAVDGVLSINLNTESIEQLISALEAIEKIEGVGDLNIKLTMDKGVTVSDSGVYLVGAVSSDANYETAFGANYLIITPDGKKVVLDWKIEDENGFVTLDAIRSGEYDLGAYVSEVYEGSVEEAEQHLITLFLGVDINGNTTVTTGQSELAIGAYTEIALMKDLGNTMYYAEPIVRPLVVVADLVDVKFIDENGSENDDRVYTYNGMAHEMTAKVFERSGELLADAEQERISYRYIGVESDGDLYNNSAAPTETGVYTVIAGYVNESETKAGMAIGAMVIKPAEAFVDVIDQVHTYDKAAVDVMGMITKTPDDAKLTVITAGIADVTDFSEEGLAVIEGIVNIDFPARVDTILTELGVPETITVADFKAWINDIYADIEAAGFASDSFTQIVDVINQLPENATLSFKEQAEANPTDIGAYIVIGAVMDPNYIPVMDQGILLITPELTEAVLEWNYVDENGILTRPILEKVDMKASALVENAVSDEITAQIQYLIFGVDKEGNTISITDPAQIAKLPNGAYTQIAYIWDEPSASMVVAEPLVRSFILVNQTVTVEAEDKEMTYNGEAQAVDITVTDVSGNAVSDERIQENLTVTYVGVDSVEGMYNSTVAPTNAGVYEVVARYAEYDAAGALAYYGADIATLVIKPADAEYSIDDTTVCPDSGEFITINNPHNLKNILVIADEENNVNIILPEGWDVVLPEEWDKDLSVQFWLDALENELNELPGEITGSEVFAKLQEVLAGIEIETLTVNGELPTAEGTYAVTGIVDGRNYAMAADDGVLAIAHKLTKVEDKEATCTTAGNKEYYICSVCEKIYEDAGAVNETTVEAMVVSAKDHDYKSVVTKAATCTDSGIKTYTCENDNTHTYTEPIPATGHDLTKVKAKAATCTTAGNKEYYTCSVCEKVYEDAKATKVTTVAKMTIKATGHDWDDGVITKKPTYAADGVMTYTCKNDKSHTYTENIKSVCEKTRDTCPIGPFPDANPTSWYHDGVHFVIEEGYMQGYPNGTFQPNEAITRIEVVTVLWNIAGKPTVDCDLNFNDVGTKHWYLPQLRWAVKNGVVEGYPNGSFQPNKAVTRQEIAAILYRYITGDFNASKTNALENSGLKDVADVQKWAKGYMNWTYEQGLITGHDDDTLRPRDNTTRAEMATILYRYLTGNK